MYLVINKCVTAVKVSNFDGPGRPLRFAAHRQPLCWNFMYHSRIVLSLGGSVRYMVRNLRYTVTIDSVLAISKTQNAFLFTVHAIFRHDYPLALEPASTPRPKVQNKTLRVSLPIDMLLSALSFLVVSQSSSEVPEGLMNNPVLWDHRSVCGPSLNETSLCGEYLYIRTRL